MNAAPANGATNGEGGPTLAPAIWDRLKAKAAELGGVGTGSITCGCLHGIGLMVDGIDVHAWLDEKPGTQPVSLAGGEASTALVRLFDESPQRYARLWVANDTAAHAIADRSEWVGFSFRVDFESLMLEMGVARGEVAA